MKPEEGSYVEIFKRRTKELDERIEYLRGLRHRLVKTDLAMRDPVKGEAAMRAMKLLLDECGGYLDD